MKRSFPFVFLVMIACGGKDGPIGPTAVRSDISTMQVGEVRVLAPTDIPNGIDLQSATSPRDFIIVVGNTSYRGDVVASYEVRGNFSAAGSVQSEQRVALAPQLLTGAGALSGSESPQQVLEKRVRGFERRALTLRAPSAPFGLGLSLRRSNQVAVAAVPVVGDVIPVKIPDPNGPNDDLCMDFFTSQAVVASVSRRAILAVDTLDGPPAGLFTPADFDAIAAEFDDMTFPTDSSYFGNPTDIDLNQRVIMLFTGRVNELTPPSTASGFVGGFFFAGDFFPVTGPPTQSCAQSNQAEIFYLLAPDPLGLKYGNVRTAAAVRQGTRGTIAHEFVHMINAGRRYTGGIATDFEVAWLDEALAHLAEDVVGRRVRNFGDLQSLAFSDVFPDETARNDFNAFFFQNFARLSRWMLRPDTSSGISAGAAANLSSRGAGWALIRYSADNYSNGEPRQYTRRLVAGPDTGVTNFTSITAASLDTVLAGYLVANYADNLSGLANISARYQYRSYDMRSIMPPVSGGQYPLKVESIGTGTATLQGTNRTGSGTYYRLTVPANAGPKNVKVTDASGAVVSFLGAHIYVLRVQ